MTVSEMLAKACGEMNIIAVIPARFESSRFPGKPLSDICGKPMIQWVYERTYRTRGLHSVFVATDDARIYKSVEEFGGVAVLTSKEHVCGTDRVAECASILGINDQDIVLNIQGDEPLISPEMIENLIDCFDDPTVNMATLAKRIFSQEEINDPNIVKVVMNLKRDALLFSRSPLPFNRDKETIAPYFKHVGVYGYRKHFLDCVSRMQQGVLERLESLEQLRVLENGYPIRVAETEYDCHGVDTPDDLKTVIQHINDCQITI